MFKLLTFAMFLGWQAHAVNFNCQADFSGDRFRFTVNGGSGGYQSSAWINGERMNPAGPCWMQERPGTSHARCSHESGIRRLEVNVWSETTSGDIIRSTAILWEGDTPNELDLSGC